MAEKKKTTKQATGRPRIEIDQAEFEDLCSMQCTLAEMAGWFRCSEDTIERWCKRTYKQGFAEVFRQKRQLGYVSLRRKSFQMAMDGNTTMMIFLLKNHLHMTDSVQIDAGHDTLDAAKEILGGLDSVIK